MGYWLGSEAHIPKCSSKIKILLDFAKDCSVIYLMPKIDYNIDYFYLKQLYKSQNLPS